jgi:hypothetical protein
MFARTALRIARMSLARSPFAWRIGGPCTEGPHVRIAGFHKRVGKARSARTSASEATSLLDRAFKGARALAPELSDTCVGLRARSRLLTETTIALG